VVRRRGGNINFAKSVYHFVWVVVRSAWLIKEWRYLEIRGLKWLASRSMSNQKRRTTGALDEQEETVRTWNRLARRLETYAALG